MANSDRAASYGVGYGKPPKDTQFKKGQSGNPKGRPKGTFNLATVLGKALRERVVINENGERRTITKLEAAAKQLVNKAASGDLTALRQLSMLVLMFEQQSLEDNSAPEVMDGADQEAVMAMLKRFETEPKGGSQ
jgi:hypothetical protein